MEKSDTHFKKNVKEVFNLISFRHLNPDLRLMGSNADKNIKFPSDFDLYEIIHSDDSFNAFTAKVLKRFQSIFDGIDAYNAEMKPDSHIYFVDMKLGINNTTGDPEDKIRWKPIDVRHGYKVLEDGTKQYLRDSFKHKSVIKIDVVAYLDSEFVPFSNMMEFYFKDEPLNAEEKTPDDIKQSILDDIEGLKSEGDYLKVMKRQLSLAKIDKDEAKYDKIVAVLNSDVGIVSKAKSDLGAMLEVLESNDDIDELTITRIKAFLQIVKSHLVAVSHKVIDIPDYIFKRFDDAYYLKSQHSLYIRINGLYKAVNKLIQSKLEQK